MPANSPAVATGMFVRRWWAVLLRGFAAIAFGVIAFAWQHVTIAVLVKLFGIYALVHGIFSLTAALTSRGEGGNRSILAVEGFVGIGAGFVTLRTPSASAKVLIFFVWAWAITTGILRIFEAIRLRNKIAGEIWLALSGVVTVLFGLMLMLLPVVGARWLAWIIAGYALLLGMFEIILACELRATRRPRIPSAA